VLHPLALQRIHGVDERISVTGYVKMVEFYTRLIRNS
jgi:acetylornithine deacetylase/succinyl-diaminopimelate desuccinylase-like protein